MRFYTNVERIGNYICVREIVNGKRKLRKLEYSPKFFVKSNKKTQYTDFENNFLKEINFTSINSAAKYYKENSELGFPLYGNINFANDWINSNYQTIKFDSTLIRSLIIDIETECEDGSPNIQTANEKINLIGMKFLRDEEKYIFGTVGYSPKAGENYYYFSSEEEMLREFVSFMKDQKPDIITGWNVEFFDIPYLVNRITKILGDEELKKISPWKKISPREVELHGKTVTKYLISGIAIMDYMAMYKKFILKPRESYKLNDIAMDELGYGKIDYNGSLKDLYTKDPQKFVEYNIRDFQLIEDLDNKLNLIGLGLFIAYDSRVNYDDVLFQVRCWNNRVIREMMINNQFVQINRKKIRKDKKFTGAFVKIDTPKIYKWVVSFDVTSLYPNIMRCLNMGFETKVLFTGELKEKNVLNRDKVFQRHFEFAKENNYTLSANGVFYRKDFKSLYYRLLTDLFNKRIEFKKEEKHFIHLRNSVEKTDPKWKEYDRNRVEAEVFNKSVKVCLNSNYGAIGNPGFIFFDIDNAEAVTITGRVIIQYVARALNELLNDILNTSDINYVALIDTDSNYLNLETLVERECIAKGITETSKIADYLDNISNNIIKPFLDEVTLKLSTEFFNSDEDLIKLIRDVISDRTIILKKKHYIMNVLDSEGERYKTPELKIMGIRAMKSNVPKLCRNSIKKMLPIILHSTNDVLLDKIEEFRKIFFNSSIEEIALNSGMKDYNKYVDENHRALKGCPYHVRAAANYNWVLHQQKLNNIYPLLKSGEKIKILYCKKNNHLSVKSIGIPTPCPEVLKIENAVSFSEQFQKAFIMPLQKILEPIGWTYERKNKIEDLF